MERKWLLFVVVAVLVALAPNADARPAYPGTAWVQSHPFTTSALIYSDIPWNPNTYKACNFNSSHPWAIPRYPHGNPILVQSSQANGLMWHCNLNASSLTSAVINQVNNLSSPNQDNGWYVRDEPSSSEFPGIADVMNWLKTNRPNSLIYMGTANWTTSYLDSLFSALQPDALSVCGYVFLQGSTRLDWWWTSTSQIRNKTLSHGVPFFRWIQAFAGYTPDRHYRIPTEGEVRFQVYTSLAAGAKGLFYFIYDRDELPDFYYALTEIGGAPTAIYYQVQGINAEVNRLGGALRFLHSDDLRYVRGWYSSSTRNSVPSGLSNWSYGAGGNTKITNVDVVKGQYGSQKDGLIGLFTYNGPDPASSGMQFFFLTNVYCSGSLNFTMSFDSSVTELHKLDRSTGQWIVVYPVNGTLNLTLPAGTGDLYAFPLTSGGGGGEDPLTDNRFCSHDLGTSNVDNKLGHHQNSDGDTTPTDVGGLNCRKPVNTGDQYFYFGVYDNYMCDLPGTTTYLEVCYYDDQSSSVYLLPQYDSTSGAYTNATPVYFTNSGKWKTATWTLPNCKFANRQNAQSDFRIYVGPYSVKIDSVRVSQVPFSTYERGARDLGSSEQYRGLSHPSNWGGSDGDTVVVTQGGRSCRRLYASGDNYFYFNVSDAIIYDGNPSTVYVKVEYYDSPGGFITPQYDSQSGAYTGASTLNFSGSNTWKTHTWTFTNCKFANRQNGSADFRLYCGTSQNVYIDRVWVSKTSF